MTSLAATLMLALATAQHPPAHEPAAPAEEAAHEAGAEHGKAGEHGKGGEGEHEKESLSDVMLGHVADGFILEYPGYCHGGFTWECETDLKEVFGDKLVFNVGGTTIDMTPTKHLVMMWIACAVLLVMIFLAISKKNLVPRGLYNFFEMLVQFVRDEIAKKNIGEHDGDRFIPFLATVFFFILFINLFGLVPWASTATGNVSVTCALALFTFLITQYAALKAQGPVAYVKHLTGGTHWSMWIIMVPVEFIGKFTKPFALTIRLFANMVAGHIVIFSLIGLIFALGSPFVALGSVPMTLFIFLLELFVSFLQAYIFTMLSALFIGEGLVTHGHGHDEEHGDEHDHGSHAAGKAPSHG